MPREAPPHPGGVLVSAFRQPEAVPSVTSLARGAELDSEDANARTNSAGASAGARGAALGTWVVAPGETLWSIARVVAPDQDPREVVEALRRVNDLRSATLRVGQTLRIPPEVARR